MTFLQSFILWGLPLLLLPVLIHLFNRLRHRPMPWAAMMFLRGATRRSTRYARLRQWLVLLLRMLALAALILALSRPLAGGWMGWLASAAPDTILILLDRSASMETTIATGDPTTKRDQAMALMARTAAALGDDSRVVAIDSVTMTPRELESAENLTELPWPRATGTAADIPALWQAGLDWLALNQPGSVEIWLASDGQTSNWRPDSELWAGLRAGLRALPQQPKIRLLMLNRSPDANAAVRLVAMRRESVPSGTGDVLELALDFERDDLSAPALPVTITLDGIATQIDVDMSGDLMRYRHRLRIPETEQGGWGSVALPADANPADNRCFFVYGPRSTARVAVTADDAFVRRVLALAVSPPRDGEQETDTPVVTLSPAELAARSWDDLGMIAWQGALPSDETGDRWRTFVREGGILALFPGGPPGLWNDLGWGEWDVSEEEDFFAVEGWDRRDGPLADSEEGWPLPLEELEVRRRQSVAGTVTALAWFRDGTPLVARHAEGRGQIYLCATLPRPDWSRLAEGDVLLPLMQRLVRLGAARLSLASILTCGQSPPAHPDGPWLPAAPGHGVNPASETGVYRSGRRWLAVNEAPAEADRTRIESADLSAMLADLPWRLFEERRDGTATEQAELWRWFLLAMVVCLLTESILILPEKSGDKKSKANLERASGQGSNRRRAA